MSDSNPSQANRIRVFVDFWNFSLMIKGAEPGFKIAWKKLGPVLVREAANLINPSVPGSYEGMDVFGSYNPKTEEGAKLHDWTKRTLSRFPGLHVYMDEMQRKKNPPSCPNSKCLHAIEECPVCSTDMKGMEEKGADVRMATKMISLAWEESYDTAVLVSTDRDFIPVAEFLATKGIKVIHGSFSSKGAALSDKCWGQINIPDFREEFRLPRK